MGISGLAHIDIGMGRRLSGQHREIQKVVNDRGSTSGNNVGFAAENESCKGTWHVNISCQNEGMHSSSTSCFPAIQIFNLVYVKLLTAIGQFPFAEDPRSIILWKADEFLV
jgi:hypothetical protein